ncbi:DUF1028 domain-containing protein [Thermomicrobium sp. 4228-Ro]|nr:DUF1028 domain-containing protein [Thermomicrobium sp. 4228-Ro]MCX2728063.1 DUF1028 domain-containing protein [Thermomicrobium sp. 4228-Ro]
MNISLCNLCLSCLATDESGIALRSCFSAVGKTRRWIGAGIGLVASRSFAHPLSGAETLRLLRPGSEPGVVREELLSHGRGTANRRAPILDSHGYLAVHTGRRCVSAAGPAGGADGCAQADTMAWDTVWQMLVHAFENTEDEFADWLLAREAGRLIVRLPYTPERVAKLKTVVGRRWHPQEKSWTVPHTDEALAHLLAFFAGEPVAVDPWLRPGRVPAHRGPSSEPAVLQDAKLLDQVR